MKKMSNRRIPLSYRDSRIDALLLYLRRGSNSHEPYKDLANRARLHPATISRLDRGITRHPRFETMVSLAYALGLEYQLREKGDE
jgi:hypothetical protein